MAYAMNKQVQARKAAEEPDQDDQLIPDGHQLESLRVEPADNGFTVTHHTRPKPGHKPKTDGKGNALAEPYDYKGKQRVFEDHARAAGHVMKVMGAHKKAMAKK